MAHTGGLFLYHSAPFLEGLSDDLDSFVSAHDVSPREQWFALDANRFAVNQGRTFRNWPYHNSFYNVANHEGAGITVFDL